MALQPYFDTDAHRRVRSELPLLGMLIERYRQQQPFAGQAIVFAHPLVLNSMPMVEALLLGGATVILSDGQPAAGDHRVRQRLAHFEVPVFPVERAVARGRIYLDVGCVLGRARPPRVAAEVTRTGVHHYRRLAVPVVSADDCQAKQIETLFGTGDSFMRAWRQLRPSDPLAGKQLVLFGFGKIGRGVAHHCRRAGLPLTVVDRDPSARHRAAAAGFATLPADPSQALQEALQAADIVIAATGVPAALASTIPQDWLRQGATLVNLGAEDEFGPAFSDADILGGKAHPLNFHLEEPTRNRYIDAPLAAHLLALEAVTDDPDRFRGGVHPLPAEMDRWVLDHWQRLHPEEDLSDLPASFPAGR